jgi:hypothetical protein
MIKTIFTLSINQRDIEHLAANKSLVRTQTTLRFVCAAQLQRYV